MKYPLSKEYSYPQIPVGEKVKIVSEFTLRYRTERDILFKSEVEDSYRQLYFTADDSTYIISRGTRECCLVTEKRVLWDIPLYFLESDEEKREPNDLLWAIGQRGQGQFYANYKARTREQAEVILKELETRTGKSHELFPLAPENKKGFTLL